MFTRAATVSGGCHSQVMGLNPPLTHHLGDDFDHVKTRPDYCEDLPPLPCVSSHLARFGFSLLGEKLPMSGLINPWLMKWGGGCSCSGGYFWRALPAERTGLALRGDFAHLLTLEFASGWFPNKGTFWAHPLRWDVWRCGGCIPLTRRNIGGKVDTNSSYSHTFPLNFLFFSLVYPGLLIQL